MKLQIKVTPSSSENGASGWLEDTLKVKVKAPPDRGRANKAVIKVLEKSLELPTGSISIIHGTVSSRKLIEIDCISDDVIKNKLAILIKGK